MKKWLIISLIVLIVVCFVVFRIIIPFQYTFTNNGVQLNTVDAYYMVRYADTFPDIPKWDYFINYPSGTPPISQLVFPIMIALASRILGVDTLTVDAILPPFFMVFILLGVFGISKILFKSNLVALITVFLLTIIPGEIMYRTMLGAGDYHCLEILLLTTTILCLFLAIKHRNDIKWLIAFSFCTLLAVFDYISVWAGGYIGLFIVGVFLYLVALVKMKLWQVLVITWVVLGVGVSYYFINTPMFIHFWNNFVKIFIPNIFTVVDEEMPLFFTSGRFDFVPMWNYFGVIFYLFLFGIGVLIHNYVKYRKPETLFLLVWTFIILAMTFAERRFAYYLVVNIAVITGYVVVLVLEKVKTRASVIKCVVGLFLVVVVPFVRLDVMLADYGRMSIEWQECTQWLRKQNNSEQSYYNGNKPEYGALSWWDYGNWIIVAGRTPAMCTPIDQDLSRNVNTASGILTEIDTDKAVEKLKKLSIRYVVITDEMFKEKLYPILITAKLDVDKVVLSDLFMYRLYYYNYISDINQVWQSDNQKVKVFEVK